MLVKHTAQVVPLKKMRTFLNYLSNISGVFSRVFLLRQIWIVKYSVKYSTVDCKYLLFLQDFFFRLKPKQYKKCQYSWLFKKTIWKLIKNKVNIYNQQLNFWLNNWHLHNWRSRKPQLFKLFLFNQKITLAKSSFWKEFRPEVIF